MSMIAVINIMMSKSECVGITWKEPIKSDKNINF